MTSSSPSSSSAFDLETHVLHRYRGEARLQRLLWIATHTTTTTATTAAKGVEQQLQHAAYEASIDLAMQQQNTSRYKEIFSHYQQHQQQQLHGSSTSETPNAGAGANMSEMNELTYDAHWYQETTLTNRQHRDVLQSRLQAAQAHLNKEAIRTAYLAVAEFASRTGDLPEAFHAVLRAKDYCTTRQQTATVSLQILASAIHLRNYHAVRDYVPRLEHTVAAQQQQQQPSSSGNGNNMGGGGGGGANQNMAVAGALDIALTNTVRNNVMTASGLEKLAMGDYKAAARKFRSVALSGHNQSTATTASPESTDGAAASSSTSPTDWDSNILAPEDISLYAAFLTLAVEDNRTVVLQLAEDAEALELSPQMKEVLLLFTRLAHYKAAFSILERDILPVLRHDLYMSQHLETLTTQIRNRAILQYWKPYQKIELAVMAEELGNGIVHASNNNDNGGTPVQVLLKTLVQLMATNRAGIGHDTRIDLQTNSLVRETVSPEQERLENASRKLQLTSTKVLNDTYSMMVRLACMENDLIVADPTSKKRRGQRGGYGGFGGGGGSSGAGQSICSDDDERDDGDDSVDYDVTADAHMMDAGDGMNPEDLY